ncbi:MAG: acyl-CoA thioesterase [Oscillospiraceae bacterium]|nr:acyl-CoA thioesterase [Oscillospiraceae bacterium]
MSAAETYIRPVHYYETDRMGIVHHSNYVRWLEEARLYFMKQKGVDYADIEAQGVLMPVVNVACRYHRSAVFGDTVKIETRLEVFNGVRAAYTYNIYSQDDTLLATANSEHCFIDETTRKPVNVKRRLKSESEIILRILSEA